MAGSSEWACPDWKPRLAWTAALAVVLIAAFHELLWAFVEQWSTEPQYSHGFIIPLMAVGLGLFRQHKLNQGRARSHPAGLVFLAVGMGLHITGRYVYLELADCLGLLCCVTGLVLLVWGRVFATAMWPAILFLAFMFPLPFRFEHLLSSPLQTLGARQAAWYIQACGIPAIAQGNTILMNDVQLGVAEACSGLRMLIVFIAMSAATMIISRRAPWEKLLVLFSAVPIALACNIGRIVATAIAYRSVGQQTADLIFHDLSGWLMMPAGMLLLYMELRLVDWLLVAVDSPEAHVSASGRAPKATPGIVRVAPTGGSL